MTIDKARLLDTFLEYVRIDSETLNERSMAERLVSDLKKLGCDVWTDEAGKAIGSNGYNVYAQMDGDPSSQPILFSAHMDTVKPGNGIQPIVQDGIIRSGGDTILASDDKSGVAGIVEALRTVREHNLPHRTVEVFFSIAEEGGLKGAKHADYSKLSAKEAVVLDGGGDTGTITTSAPGQIKFEATITGKSAHAGIEPEKGISAIQAASAAISAMNLLRIDEETTANIGTFTSQYATNIVPEKAYIQGEARSRSVEKLKKQEKHMLACLRSACDRFGAQLDYTADTTYLSYDFPEEDPFVQAICDACRSIGRQPSFEASGGGSDANIMNHNGIKAVVLATGMEKVHTIDEQISVRNLEDTAALCLALMTQKAKP